LTWARLAASSRAKPKDSETPFAEFADAIQKAQADAETRNVALIAKAAQDGTWTAAAWWLERKYPERWGRKERHEVTGKDGGALTVKVLRGVSMDDL
jgi:hypothetical protein